MTGPGKILSQAGFDPGSSAPEVDALTTRPVRRRILWEWYQEKIFFLYTMDLCSGKFDGGDAQARETWYRSMQVKQKLVKDVIIMVHACA